MPQSPDRVKELEQCAKNMKVIIDDALSAMSYGDNDYAWDRLPDALAEYRKVFGEEEEAGA